MTLDEGVLADVFDARTDLERLEHQAWEARGAFHREVRRLHATGGSLREIAEALGMSHQRVHQIIGEDALVEVETSATELVPIAGADPAASDPDSQSTAVTPAPSAPALLLDRCCFCGASRQEVDRMLAAPGRRFICGACVGHAAAALAGAATEAGPLHSSSSDEPCSFCGRAGHRVEAKGGDALICAECVTACQRAVTPDRRRPSGVRRRPAHRCSFCNATAEDARQLVASGPTFICPDCLATAAGVAAAGTPATGPRQATFRVVQHRCLFCEPQDERGPVVQGGRGRICTRCIDVARRALTADQAAG